jgi:predicted lipid-binding transport protein (Tim44 family)
MSARPLCPHCWLEAVKERLHELEREDFRGSAHDALRDAREAWYVGDLAGIAEATRRAEAHIAQELVWERESLETARGLRR